MEDELHRVFQPSKPPDPPDEATRPPDSGVLLSAVCSADTTTVPTISATPTAVAFAIHDVAADLPLFGTHEVSNVDIRPTPRSSNVHNKFAAKKNDRAMKKKHKRVGMAHCSMAVNGQRYKPAISDLKVQDFIQETANVTKKKKTLCSRPSTNISKKQRKSVRSTLSPGLDNPMVTDSPHQNQWVIDEVPLPACTNEGRVDQDTNGRTILDSLAAWLDAIGARKSDGTPPIVDGATTPCRKETWQAMDEVVDGKEAWCRNGGGNDEVMFTRYGQPYGTSSFILSEGTCVDTTGTTIPTDKQVYTTAQMGNIVSTGSIWDKPKTGVLSYAELIKKSDDCPDTKLDYFPPVITKEGKVMVVITEEDLAVSAKAYSLHLYGYFIGTSMDYKTVNMCIRRLWRAYDLDDVSKSPTGFFYFKFKSEKGMNEALENGPWMVNNVPIFLNTWSPGLCLNKIEPSVVPLWVTIHNVPLDLWTRTGICKLMSRMGDPKLMDKATFERCAKHTGRLGFARVLVDVKASSNLPTEIEVQYPSGTVNLVSYQWKPPLCSHCEVFGHTFGQCTHKPKTVIDEEMIDRNLVNNTPDDGMEKVPASSMPMASPTHAPNVVSSSSKVFDEHGFEVVTKRKHKGNNNSVLGPSILGPVPGSSHASKSVSFSRSNLSNKGKEKMQGGPISGTQGKNMTSSPSKHASTLPVKVNPYQRTRPNGKKAPVKLATGFNFQKAVLGGSSKSTTSKLNNMVTSNRFEPLIPNSTDPDDCIDLSLEDQPDFSVLNIDASLKSNTLVSHSKPASTPPVNGSLPHLNDPFPTGLGRVLPKWDPPEVRKTPKMVMDIDYGISRAQKKRISDCLHGKNKAVKWTDQEKWVNGEWNFFNDLCMELGLNPDFCVEEVVCEDDVDLSGYYDDYMSSGLNTGIFFDPVVSKPKSSK